MVAFHLSISYDLSATTSYDLSATTVVLDAGALRAGSLVFLPGQKDPSSGGFGQ
jgi:hypothetical protein